MSNTTQSANSLAAHLEKSHQEREKFLKRFDPKYTNPVLLGIIIVLIIVWIGSKIFAADANGYWINIFTDTVGMTITILVIDRLNDYRLMRERKLALFRQVKSRSNDVAVEALEQIQHESWWDEILEHYRDEAGQINLRAIQWSGGVDLNNVGLEKAKLEKANLQEANLWQADLRGAKLEKASLQRADLQSAMLHKALLTEANLKHANLRGAYLQHAVLDYSDLKEANLSKANLRNTIMGWVNLKKADLSKANLKGAILREANLRGASLHHAQFNEKTVLPDAKPIARNNEGKFIFDKYYIDGQTDMRCYTDPKHPNFWEPPYLKPDYDGEKPWWVEKQDDKSE